MVAAARAYKLPAALRKKFPQALTQHAADAPGVILATARELDRQIAEQKAEEARQRAKIEAQQGRQLAHAASK